MGAIGRLFGLGLVIAGLVIAVYWTAWVLMLLPFFQTKFSCLSPYFLEPVWIFRLPAIALIGGICFIAFFIINTNRKIEAERAAKAAAAAGKKVQ